MIGTKGEIVCPEPSLWHDIWERLTEAARTAGVRIPDPPRPLILGAWWGSTDLEKQGTWKETVDWAARWGFSEQIGEIPAESMHRVDPVALLLPLISLNPYRQRNYTRRKRPSPEEEADALNILRSNWTRIAGTIAPNTRPLSFTGSRRRRLLVAADEKFRPRWGEWNRIYTPSAIYFTRFRRLVNNAIEPHGVDHIDFNF